MRLRNPPAFPDINRRRLGSFLVAGHFLFPKQRCPRMTASEDGRPFLIVRWGWGVGWDQIRFRVFNLSKCKFRRDKIRNVNIKIAGFFFTSRFGRQKMQVLIKNREISSSICQLPKPSLRRVNLSKSFWSSLVSGSAKNCLPGGYVFLI